MRHLILMRHGDAELAENDFARVLSPRGIAECQSTADQLLAADLRPGRVICSQAPRAHRSAQIVAKHLGLPIDTIERSTTLYLAQPQQYLAAIRQTDESVHCVLLVAHNPGLSALAGQLRQTSVALKTGDYSVYAGSGIRWSELSGGAGMPGSPAR